MKRTHILLAPDSAPAGGATAPAPGTGNAPSSGGDAPATPDSPAGADLDPFAELEQMQKEGKLDDNKAADKPVEPKKDEKPKPAEEKPKEPENKDKKPEPAADKNIATGPKALREQLEKKNGEVSTLTKQLSEAQAKLKVFESKGPEQTKLTEHVAAITKERDELRQQLRAAKREHSPEFIEKFITPIEQAAGFAKELVEGMTITETSPDGDKTRQATWDDFRAIYQMPLNKATQIASQLFGSAAPAITQQIVDLKKLEAARTVAARNENALWDKLEKESIARSNAEEEQRNAVWGKVNADLLDKHPEWGEVADDSELNQVRAKGYELVDKVFSKSARETMTPAQRIVLDANIRHRAANYPRLKLEFERTQQELTEARAKIEELEKEGPTQTRKPGGDTAPATPKSWEEDLTETMA